MTEKTLLDTGKLERFVGWKPKVGFEEGFERAIMWFVSKKRVS
jgi:nucleoside-diphosphate-sugar epimerase